MVLAEELANTTSMNIPAQISDTKVVVLSQLDGFLHKPIALVFMTLFDPELVSYRAIAKS